jgi:hypothetical protein
MWLVIYRRQVTFSQFGEAVRFATKEAAEECAREFNRHSQDRTWNCVVAVVQNSRERVA